MHKEYYKEKKLCPAPQTWDKDNFVQKLLMVQKQIIPTKNKKYFLCQVCNCINGREEYTDNIEEWTWPSGLLHYVQEHNYKPSNSFVKYIKNKIDMPRKVTDLQTLKTIRDHKIRKPQYFAQFLANSAYKRARITLAEIRRQIFNIQAEEVVAFKMIPFHENMPSIFFSLNMKCKDDSYNCNQCYNRNKCFVKATETLTRRINKRYHLHITDYDIFHRKMNVGEVYNSIIDSLKDVFLYFVEKV